VLAGLAVAQVGFNYLGRFAAGVGAWQLAGESPIGASVDRDMPAVHVVEAGAVVRDTPEGPVLTVSLSWAPGVLDDGVAERLGRAWLEMLSGLAAHTTDPIAGGHTPSDFPLLDLAQDEVEELEAEFTDDNSYPADRKSL
jgi:nonribosomal peptide synthetase CepB